MTNRLAILIGCLVLGFFLLDAWVLGWESHVWLMRTLWELIRTLAFWR